VNITVPAELVEAVAQRAAELVLAELAEVSAPAREESPFLTIPEAATYLRCKRQHVDDLLSQRHLTRYKDGGRTLVLRAEIDARLRRETW
jgi:excisionase family DNA binding protein